MNYIIIPDLHGQYYKLLSLIKQFVKIENGIIKESKYKIILLGDFIDKGPKEEQIKLTEFIYNNLKQIYLVLGNHEEGSFKTLKGFDESNVLDFNKSLSPYYKNHFVPIAIDNPELKEIFYEIYSKMFRIIETEHIICTHSPCLIEHIKEGSSLVTKYSYPRKKDFKKEEDFINYMDKFILEITKDSEHSKLHFSGHLEIGQVIKNNNQIWLDTNSKVLLTIAVINEGNLLFYNEKGLDLNVFKENCPVKVKEFIFEKLKMG